MEMEGYVAKKEEGLQWKAYDHEAAVIKKGGFIGP
jgi:hypothetical protein